MDTGMNQKTAITNVRIFDGHQLTNPRTVVIDGSVIGVDPTGATVVDAGGATLLPGLIDAHVHLHGPDTLQRLAGQGVTTALDMATWPQQLLDRLRAVPGVTDVRSAGLPAIGPAGPHAHFGMPDAAILRTADQAAGMVSARIAAGSDYLKIVLEPPGSGGPEPAAAQAFVSAAHAHGKKVIAHASAAAAYTLALQIGADIITHVPLGPPLEQATIDAVVTNQAVVVPTLCMMEGLARAFGKADAFLGALASGQRLHTAGVPILAGTDANTSPGSPSPIEHGTSLHHELELLVRAGLTNLQALRSATSRTAEVFGLTDRGAIAVGLRADLLLVDGDPLHDITATSNVVHVWCAGHRYR